MEDKVRAKKSYGQNFLNNDTILEQISSLCGNSDRLVIEIGPGTGALTKKLSSKYERVCSIELDKTLQEVLENQIRDCDNVEVRYEDFLKSDIKDLINGWDGKVSVCANIPYYITSEIIDKLMDNADIFDTIVLLIQKEVADKLCAKTGSGEAVPLTYKVQYYSNVSKCLSVAPGNFNPPPKVYSTVIKMEVKKTNASKNDTNKLFELINAGFYQRRKKFVNSVCEKGISDKEKLTQVLNRLNIDENIRGENLTLEDYQKISKELT